MGRQAPASPLVLLGIDAGDPDLLERWAAEGYLPTLASLMERGCWGKTGGPEMLSRQGLWLTLFSGISRSRHGYFANRQLEPGTYTFKRVTARDAKALPFWAHLSGKKIAIVDAPDVAPIAGLDGVQLADWAVFNSPFEPSSEPKELLEEISDTFERRLLLYEEADDGSDADLQIHRKLLDAAREKGRLARDLLGRDRFDLIVVAFTEAHPAGHYFWSYRREKPDADEPQRVLSNAIRDVYCEIDRQMATLLDQIPREATVLVVSSAGMTDRYPTAGLLEDFCTQLGYWDSASWADTAAFPIRAAHVGFLRVNLRGREPDGIVDPGEDYTALLQRLEDDLLLLADPRSGTPVIERVVRTAEAFGGGPPLVLPDLFVEWKSTSGVLREVIHPAARLTQQEPAAAWNGHSSTGFVAAAGPGIPRGALGDVPLLDLAPTFLALLGEPVPEEMPGRVLFGRSRRAAAT